MTRHTQHAELHDVFVSHDRPDGWQNYFQVLANVDPVGGIVYGAVIYTGEQYDAALGDWRACTKPELKQAQADMDSGRFDADVLHWTRSKLDKEY